MESDTQPITISVNADGQVFLQETEVAVEDVVPMLGGDRRHRL